MIKSREILNEKDCMLKLTASTTQSELELTHKPTTHPPQQLFSAAGKSEHLDVQEEPVHLSCSYKTNILKLLHLQKLKL